MIEDQKHILNEIIRHAKKNNPDAILIAGDIYDRSVPPVDAVQLLDDFLVELNALGITIFLISGNHDSVERIAFGASFLQKSNIHIAQSYNGKITAIPVQDEFGQINIWMLPYLKPATVRPYFPNNEIITYSDALSTVLSNSGIDTTSRNILLTHQFVTNAIPSESEELTVGNSENVDAYLFDDFDYVALGHIHKSQYIDKKTIRYCGTPLKYAVSEINHVKSITMVEVGIKNNVTISEIHLSPRREMRKIRGSYAEVTARKNYTNTKTDDYVYIILTDEEDEPDAAIKLRNIYPNLLFLVYDNKRTHTSFLIDGASNLNRKSPVELFGELYELQNGQIMSPMQEEYTRERFRAIWEGNI
jgi:exonuclease SbcD